MSDETKPEGRPPIIKTSEEMYQRVEEYFVSLLPKPIMENGRVLTTDKGQVAYTRAGKPSVVGLALFLGYADRVSFYDNIKKEEFSYILKKARSRVELGVLEGGMDDNIPQALTIFLLKQLGYTDKPVQEVENFDDDRKLLDGLVNSEE